MAPKYLSDALELAGILRPTWPDLTAELYAAGVPLNEGEGGEGGEGEGGEDAGAGGEGEGEKGGEGEGKKEPDWKAESRKHERRAKEQKKLAEQLQADLEKAKEGSQSEQEKALAKAKKEARDEALAEAAKERRSDRLDVAVTRLSAKTFADTEDALVNVERAIANGDIDEDDIFDAGGRVDTAALKKELDALLERKPHLKANNGGRPSGDGDGGKGEGGGAKTLNEILRAQHAR